MKKLNMIQITSSVVTLLVVVMLSKPAIVMAAQPTVELGTTSGFAVLAKETITNTGTTTISGSVNGNVGGDVGLFSGEAFTGKSSITMSGDEHLADAVAIQAETDLTTAYNDAAGRTPVTTIQAELGETTLKPGTYKSTSGKFQITGNLTLDAEGDPDAVFVFQTESTLITADASKVNLINGARFCRTFWQVGSSATLGKSSKFVGHIFAMISITATTGAEVQGQLLARTGSVTLDSNKIINGICEVTPDLATLKIIKHVVNNNGGKKVATDFNIHIKTLGNDVVASPAPGSESGKTYTLASGDYVISEGNIAGYSANYKGSDSNGKIALAPGDNKTVTITNDDIKVTSSVNESSDTEKPKVVTTTVTGGTLPETSTHLYEILIMGAALTIIGALGWVSRKRFE